MPVQVSFAHSPCAMEANRIQIAVLLEVGPLTDVTRANLLRVCKPFSLVASRPTPKIPLHLPWEMTHWRRTPNVRNPGQPAAWPDGACCRGSHPRHAPREPRTIGLFGHRDYGLVIKGRYGDSHRCGSAGLIIIVGVRRVGDGPFREAVYAASVQKNCHHSYPPWWLI